MKFKSLPNYNTDTEILKIDRENGIIKDVQIVKHGKNKNGSYFNNQFLTDLVNKGNEQKQGVKCRFGHPNACMTSLGTYLGRYKNHTLKDNKVFADLHLDPISRKTQVEGKGISMYEYVMEMAENNPDVFGNSIVVSADYFEETLEDNTTVESLELNEYIASDLVDEPAATDGLFSNSDDLGIIITNFLDENPQIFEVVEKQPQVIGDFFSRYINYNAKKTNTKANMGLLDAIKKAFGSEDNFNIDVTLGNGDIITVVTEAEEPQVGDEVKKEDGTPLDDGDHTTTDGGTWVVEEGKIKEMKPKEEPPAPTEPTNEEVMQSVKNLADAFSTFKEKDKKEKADNEEAMQLMFNQLTGLNKKFETLAKSVGSKFNVVDEGNDPNNPTSEKGSTLKSLKERKEELKKRK